MTGFPGNLAIALQEAGRLMAEGSEGSGAGSTKRGGSPDAELDPYWEKLDPRDGLPTWEALYHFVDRERAVSIYRRADRRPLENFTASLSPRSFIPMDIRLHNLGRVVEQLLFKLKAGELRARGFASNAPLDMPRQDVHRDRWGDLELDVRASRAQGPGIIISQILVFAAEPSVGEGRSPRKQHSPTALRAWYIDRLQRLLLANERSSREEDYLAASAHFGGSVPRRPVEDLRRELAPASWKQGGRPGKG